MEKVNGIRTFNPSNRKAWRKWLTENHTSVEPVCLIVFHKKSKTPNISSVNNLFFRVIWNSHV
jgi:hypothetical protein